jgi:hypothetical protein
LANLFPRADGIEAQSVIALRSGGARMEAEANRMVTEKVAAAVEALSARNSSPRRGCVASWPPLASADIDGAGLELDRRPLQAAELRHPQSMTKPDQDHRCVAVAVAVALGRLDQALDFTLGQVLAIATHFAVAASAKRDCP